MALRLRVNAAILATLGLLGLQGCSSEAEITPAKEFQFQIPVPKALTLEEISELKASLCGNAGDPPVHSLSAAVFDDYSAKPRVNDPGWRSFITFYGEVRADAIRCGWSVQIEGFTQSSDPVGTEDDLSQRRADATRQALIEVGYPANAVVALGRGVGGALPSDRRVDVKFVRK